MNEIITIFRYRFYVKEILVLFFTFFMMYDIFSWILIQNSTIIQAYHKILSLILYAFIIYRFGDLKKSERIYVALFSLYILKLVLESLAKYDTPFKQFTMFTVLFPGIYAFYIKYILRLYDLDLMEFMAKFFLFTYIIFMLLFGRGFSFSLEMYEMEDYGPFSGDSRIMHASHIFMMIIPLLWYLNEYIHTRKNKFLIPFLFCAAVILVHQHRSVWSSSLFSIMLFLFMNIRNRYMTTSKITGLFVSSLVLIFLFVFFVSNLMPGFLEFLSDRFSEIFEPSKEGSTGNFRVQQREVYGEMFFDKPIFGWTFEGFEMENPLVDWWPSGTGQHFHEGYMEMLFYLGITGFLMKYGLIFYICSKAFNKNLSENSIISIAFCAAALLFSFNYVLPLIYWAFLGMCLYYLDIDQKGESGNAVNLEMHRSSV